MKKVSSIVWSAVAFVVVVLVLVLVICNPISFIARNAWLFLLVIPAIIVVSVWIIPMVKSFLERKRKVADAKKPVEESKPEEDEKADEEKKPEEKVKADVDLIVAAFGRENLECMVKQNEVRDIKKVLRERNQELNTLKAKKAAADAENAKLDGMYNA